MLELPLGARLVVLSYIINAVITIDMLPIQIPFG